jgi:hypothetical protein
MLLGEKLTVYSEKCMEHIKYNAWLKYIFLNVRARRSYSITILGRAFRVRRMRLPEFIDIRQMKVVSLPTPRTGSFTPRRYTWYLFLLDSNSIPGPKCGRKDSVNEKSH